MVWHVLRGWYCLMVWHVLHGLGRQCRYKSYVKYLSDKVVTEDSDEFIEMTLLRTGCAGMRAQALREVQLWKNPE